MLAEGVEEDDEDHSEARSTQTALLCFKRAVS